MNRQKLKKYNNFYMATQTLTFSPNKYFFTISLWLLNFEFSDTILLITKEKIIFAVSPKKSKYFNHKMFEHITYLFKI